MSRRPNGKDWFVNVALAIVLAMAFLQLTDDPDVLARLDRAIELFRVVWGP